MPPEGYGGTERVVSYLTEELVRAGHDVTLFASGDSETAPAWCRAARGRCAWTARSTRSRTICSCWSGGRGGRSEFDVIHFHVDYLHFPLSRRLRRRT